MSLQHGHNAKLRCKASTTFRPWASSANHLFRARTEVFKPWKFSMTKQGDCRPPTSMPNKNHSDLNFLKASSALKNARRHVMGLLATQLMLSRDQYSVYRRKVAQNIFLRLKKRMQSNSSLKCGLIYRELQNITWKRMSIWVQISKNSMNGNALFKTLQRSQTT